MSDVLVVVVKGTGLVVAGVARRAGGAVPSVAELVGDSLKASLDSKNFVFPAAALALRRITAAEKAVTACAGKTVEGTGDTATFQAGAPPLVVDHTGTNVKLSNTHPEPLTGSLTIVDAKGEFVVSAQQISMQTGATPKVFPVSAFTAPFAVYVTARPAAFLA